MKKKERNMQDTGTLTKKTMGKPKVEKFKQINTSYKVFLFHKSLES